MLHDILFDADEATGKGRATECDRTSGSREPGGAAGLRGGVKRFLSAESAGIYGFLIALIVLFTLLTRAFLTFENFIVILRQVSIIGICAFGETLVVIAGGIDLSVGSTVALSGVIAAVLAKFFLVPVPACFHGGRRWQEGSAGV